MARFIDIVVTGDLGDMSADNWADIHSEYSELSQNSSAIQGLSLAIDIHYLTNRIKNVYFIVNYLNTRRVDGLIEQLKEMGFNFKYAELATDLPRVMTRLKTDELKLKSSIEKYEAQSGGESTKLDWYRRLSQLSKHNQYQINPALITVLDFVALEKEFITYVAAQK